MYQQATGMWGAGGAPEVSRATAAYRSADPVAKYRSAPPTTDIMRALGLSEVSIMRLVAAIESNPEIAPEEWWATLREITSAWIHPPL